MKTPKAKKYSINWKYEQQDLKGGWAQKHGLGWAWHYIRYDVEYQMGRYNRTKKECERAHIFKVNDGKLC